MFQQILDPKKTSVLHALVSCAQITRMEFASVLIEVF